MLGPRIGRRGSRERPTFFLYNPSSNPLGNCKQPLVVHFELILRPPLSGRSIAIYCALKCTLHHLGFGTADCNNFYDPRTSLDVTPTPPRGPLYTHTPRRRRNMSADLIRGVYHICFRPRSPQIEKRGITEFLLNYGGRGQLHRFNSCSFRLMTIDQP